MAEEKHGTAGASHLELGEDANLEAAGLHKVQEKEIRARNADFAAAIGDKPPNPWGRGYLQLYCMCFVVYLCSTMNGEPVVPQAHDCGMLTVLQATTVA